MTQRSVAPFAARELIVSLIGLYPGGCRESARARPVASTTGAAAAEASAHDGIRFTAGS